MGVLPAPMFLQGWLVMWVWPLSEAAGVGGLTAVISLHRLTSRQPIQM